MNGAKFLYPTNNAQTITKSDAATYDPPLRLLYVGGAGDVAITTGQGDVVTITGLVAGAIVDWVRISKVMSTNTTATSMLGFW